MINIFTIPFISDTLYSIWLTKLLIQLYICALYGKYVILNQDKYENLPICFRPETPTAGHLVGSNLYILLYKCSVR